MPTPPKPAAILRMEGRSHRTQAELESREKAEQALLSGRKIREAPAVAADPLAHRAFRRIITIMEAIGKNDALYEGVMNRYAALCAECARQEELRGRLERRLDQLHEWVDSGAIDPEDYWEKSTQAINQIADCDNMLQRKRKMMLDIEKENVMTVASALRSIPKATPADDLGSDPMSELLNSRLAR